MTLEIATVASEIAGRLTLRAAKGDQCICGYLKKVLSSVENNLRFTKSERHDDCSDGFMACNWYAICVGELFKLPFLFMEKEARGTLSCGERCPSVKRSSHRTCFDERTASGWFMCNCLQKIF